MEFKEYVPKGGYIAYNKHREIISKVKTTTMTIVAFVAYAAVVTIAESI
ncbi:hypothetical protein SAMN05720470_10125 [Fibrobacter sp. UWOV1]|nr:hypothetical protein [Fibrobacter sp. UWOV1]SHK28071.1 hypothetical protein SAMN05720470_10125 [Fibrobacter sp. UWOV1]